MSGTRPPDVSIIIVAYNSRGPLEECLPSIQDSGTRASYETIVVDNNSPDGTAEFVETRFPWVRVVKNGTNLGYSTAVNQGTALSRGRYVLVLNPDIVVLPGAIDRLVDFADDHDDAGIAASKLTDADGTLQHSCRRFYTFWTLLLRRTFLGRVFRNSRAIRDYLMLDYDHERPAPVDWVIGACMLVRRRALADVGPMDERFFLYFEDVDWCYRMWRGGWKIYYVADSVMRHRYARASARPRLSKQLLAHFMSLIHFYEKWGGVLYRLKRYRRVLLTGVRLLSDVIAINGAFALAYLLRSSLRGLLEKPMFGVQVYSTFMVFANIVFLFSFAFFGLYGPRTDGEDGAGLILRVFRATVVAAIILMASTYLTSQTLYSRVLVGVFCVLVVVLAALLRLGQRGLHRLVRAGRFDLKRVVIVGTGRSAQRLGERIAVHSELGYDLVGLVSTDGGHRAETRFPVVGTLDGLMGLVEEHRVGEVIFADPDLSSEEVAKFLLEARRMTIDVKMVSGLAGVMTQRARIEEFLDTPVVVFEREALLRAGAGAKRALDVVGSILLLAVWSPFLLLAAIVTLLTGRGAPLERTERAGRDGSVFGMYTLRSPESRGPLRRFVVRHGLSAFPAALNVLRGEMSLVGPEPVAPCDVTGSGSDLVRLDARPGMAGLSQVASDEGAPAEEGAIMDAYYVRNWTLGGDVRILLRWIGRALAGRCRSPQR